jgi:hypothetical protein
MLTGSRNIQSRKIQLHPMHWHHMYHYLAYRILRAGPCPGSYYRTTGRPADQQFRNLVDSAGACHVSDCRPGHCSGHWLNRPHDYRKVLSFLRPLCVRISLRFSILPARQAAGRSQSHHLVLCQIRSPRHNLARSLPRLTASGHDHRRSRMNDTAHHSPRRIPA